MHNPVANTPANQAAKPKRRKKTPWHKRLSRWFDRIGHFLGLFGVSFSGVYLLNCFKPLDLAGREIDPTLTFEVLNPDDIPQMKEHRDELLTRGRLEKGYMCWVAKNQQGEIDQVLWFTDRPYYCWPIRTLIDPGPRGWYCFDGFTMAHARRKHRFSQNFTAWFENQPPGTGPVVGIVSLWNDAALDADRKVGFEEICRVYCISVFGFKLIRVRRRLPESAVQWLARSRGKNFTYDACTLQIF